MAGADDLKEAEIMIEVEDMTEVMVIKNTAKKDMKDDSEVRKVSNFICNLLALASAKKLNLKGDRS